MTAVRAFSAVARRRHGPRFHLQVHHALGSKGQKLAQVVSQEVV